MSDTLLIFFTALATVGLCKCSFACHRKRDREYCTTSQQRHGLRILFGFDQNLTIFSTQLP